MQKSAKSIAVKCLIGAALVGGLLGIAPAGLAAGEAETIQRAGLSYDRSSLVWNEWGDVEKEKAAGQVPASGWVEYDIEVKHTGWYELWLSDMPSDWTRDVSVDGNMVFRYSIALADDADGKRSKEGNLYLQEGKHALRIRRTAPPGRLPSKWQLVPASGRPEASVVISSVTKPIIAPGEKFEVELTSGTPTRALKYELQLKSLVDESLTKVGSVEFAASNEPSMKKVTIQPPGKGAYVLVASSDGHLLRPNDVKVRPLIVTSTPVPTPPKPMAPTTLEVAGVYSSGMVVQRDVPLPVWGIAPPGTEVKIKFAEQSQSATADARGNWRAMFAPLRAPGPYTLSVSDGKTTRSFDDLLAGDVWLLGGQSNMGAPMKEIIGGQKAAETDGKYPMVRMGIANTGAPGTREENWVRCAWQKAAPPAGQGPEALWKWNGIAFSFGIDLHRKLDVPIGVVLNNRGGTFISTWTSLETQKTVPAFSYDLRKWQDLTADGGLEQAVAATIPGAIRSAQSKAAAATATQPAAALNLDQAVQMKFGDVYRNYPAKLYEQLTVPLAPFPFKGVVWYQGESDSNRAFQYASMLKAFVGDWRKLFNNPELPFVVVQIAYGTGTPNTDPAGDSYWGEQQEAQESILSEPHTSLVTTYDLPRPTDNVHYLDKLPVGRRAALAALRDVYQMKDIVSSGPTFDSMKVEGKRIRLHFKNVGSGLKSHGDRLSGFSIAGDDHKFAWADAVIEGDDVIVSSPDVSAPVAVRYGWSNKPCGANLFNNEGLPARIFRTDRWPSASQPLFEKIAAN